MVQMHIDSSEVVGDGHIVVESESVGNLLDIMSLGDWRRCYRCLSSQSTPSFSQRHHTQ